MSPTGSAPRIGNVPSEPRRSASDAFVFIGATGDLGFKRILPALAGFIRDSERVAGVRANRRAELP